MNKKVMTLSAFGLASILLSSISGSVLKSGGPPSCHAGEPPNNFNCSSCHSGPPVNTGTADVLLDLDSAENGYRPGETYTIRVSIERPGLLAAGFQLIALREDDAGTTPGEMILDEPARTQTIDQNNPHLGNCSLDNKVWVEHKYAGILADSGKNSWTFSWRAPDTDAGNVSFYVAVLDANLDLEEYGDSVYTRQKTIGNRLVGLRPLNQLQVRVYPNPVQSSLLIETNGEMEEVTLFSFTGHIWKQFTGSGLKNDPCRLVILLDQADPGVYVLQVKGKDQLHVQKVLITP